MKLNNFIDKRGNILISVIVFIDFSIASCLWIISSPYIGNFGKVISMIFMIAFGFLPYILPLLVKLLKVFRKESGKPSYSEELLKKQQSFNKLFFFFYIVLLFFLNRVMNFIEFSLLSYFVLKLIYLISTNLLFGFTLYVIEIKHKGNGIIGVLLIYNSFALFSVFL